MNSIIDKHNKYDLRLIVFLFIIGLIFLRQPQIILKGRFWAEEASVYFKQAYNHNIISSIFFVDMRCGYFYLSATISAVLASLVPLKLAPLVTTNLSLLIMLLIIYTILYVPSNLFKNIYQRIYFSVIMTVGAHIYAEVWLNSINTQVFWGIYGILILFSKMEELSRTKRLVLYIMLFIGSLSGLYCVILAPLFALKYILTRNKYVKQQMLITVTSFCLQIIVVLVTKLSGQLSDTKMNLAKFTKKNIIDIINYHLLLPFIGNQAIREISYVITIILGIVIMAVVLFTLYFTRKQMEKFKILGILVFLQIYYMAFVLIGSHGNNIAGRYAVISSSIIILIFINVMYNLEFNFLNKVKIIMFAIPIIIGLIDYQGNFNYKYLDYNQSPRWENEIHKLEKDSDSTLTVWPYDRWKFKLKE